MPLILVLFCMVGCVEKAPEQSVEAPPKLAGDSPPRLQVDFDSEVNSDLFRVRGDLTLWGNRSLPYLLLNATLRKGGLALKSTKYMMIDVEPGGDHSFEISKNMRIPPGCYNCTLEVSGPQGPLTCETRRCKETEPWIEPSPAVIRFPQQEHDPGVVPDVEEAFGKREDEAAKSSAPSGKGDAGTEGPTLEEKNVSSPQGGKSAGVTKAAPEESEAKFVGSSSSKKYHRPDCRYASKIKADKKVYFANRAEAKRQGYLPCKVCNP